jgi:hypothetical protein
VAVGQPFAILDLPDGGERAFTVLSAEIGEAPVMARGELRPRRAAVLRLHLDPADVETGLPYLDVAAATLYAQLRPIVLAPAYRPRRFTIRKVGAGLGARFSVSSGPIGGVTAA